MLLCQISRGLRHLDHIDLSVARALESAGLVRLYEASRRGHSNVRITEAGRAEAAAIAQETITREYA